ncbi:hypothetical protein EXIGLDRAFT_765412 [Exidia glandulosa HHB12029]|uniref:Uncharacterized protein n=1 Tax=Exidia glandulosa HHB12029 TaxID=1314781 RepID=A0A165KGR3_EXIGL|nr:hypothetical protein EXIGLDRAFT_765412 [Exidia glandulosa HHB12029]
MSLSFPSFSCYLDQGSAIQGVSADTDAKITMSLDAMFVAITLCQVALSIRVVSGRSVCRPAFVALTCAIIATTFSLALDIAAAALSLAAANMSTAMLIIGAVQNLAQCFAEILSLSSAFLAMRSRHASPNLSRLKAIGWQLKYSLDAATLLALLAISIAGIIETSIYSLRPAYRALYGFAVLDLTFTVWYLRSRVAKSVERHDKVIDSLACLVSPLLATNLLASMAMIGECDNSVWTFSLIEKGMVPALTFTIFLSLGLSPSVWKSGEDEGKQRWSS